MTFSRRQRVVSWCAIASLAFLVATRPASAEPTRENAPAEGPAAVRPGPLDKGVGHDAIQVLQPMREAAGPATPPDGSPALARADDTTKGTNPNGVQRDTPPAAAADAATGNGAETKPAVIQFPPREKSDKPKVKVFILAGQSNMQGKGSLEHLDKLVKDEPAKFGHLKKDGKWIERDDVFVVFPQLGPGGKDDMKGKLSVGFTWPPKARVGPELGFGEVVGDAIDEPVLLVKACWGGQSLDVDFRPPSAGWDREFDLANRDQWKPGTQGWAYKQIFNNLHTALDDLGSNIPELKGRDFEIAGLVWFQGWNDLINGQRVDAYEKNLSLFIRDIRKHLGKPSLPVVIGVMGQDGDKPADNMKKMRAAQTAPAAMPEFKGTVAAVQTYPFWDPTVKYDGGYHYMGSARFYYDAGTAMGKAMVQLLDEQKKAAAASR